MPTLLAALLLVAECAAASPAGFWAQQRRGANFFNEHPERERFRAAREAGIAWVRLAPDKWETAERDFLIGDADGYDGLVEADLRRLRDVLDVAHEERMPVALTLLSLPGCRWRQHNDGRDDGRLWKEERFHEQAARLWRDLAGALRGHPALVGYNPLNEPHPERALGLGDGGPEELYAWSAQVRGSAADLNLFYRRVVAEIRAADPEMPILLDAGSYASPPAWSYLEPVDDPATLYSFHMYEPYGYTNKRINAGRFRYPGVVDDAGEPRMWDRAALARFLEPVAAWQQRHRLGPERIVAAEFGGNREVPGLESYLADLVALFEERGWHWAFYAFREDSWAGMDYEAGTGGLGAAYWRAVERGERPRRPRSDNPLWTVLKDALAASR